MERLRKFSKLEDISVSEGLVEKIYKKLIQHGKETEREFIEEYMVDKITSSDMGVFKAERGIPIKDEACEEALLKKIEKLAEEKDLPVDLVKDIFRYILDDSCDIQMQVANFWEKTKK